MSTTNYNAAWIPYGTEYERRHTFTNK